VGKNSITLPECPEEGVTQAYIATLSLIPEYTNCTFDPDFIDKYHDPILQKMMASIYSQTGKDWFNADMADRAISNYNRMVVDSDRDHIETIKPTGLADYTKFLPAVMSSIVSATGKKRSSLREFEVREAVSTAFRDTVIDLATKSQLYIVNVSIDIYKDEKFYRINPPNGFHFLKNISIQQVKAKFPKDATIVDGEITLKCCPDNDIFHAWEAEISVIPKRNTCIFDAYFIDRYYEPILSGIMARLTMQGSKDWGEIGLHDRHKKDYDKYIVQAKRKNSSGVVKVRQESLTET
ncbi:MAG: hypothetical protein KAH25_09145, partial [Bacteroidales bacterium]|nr:hypothetical protein [Bacteroidales bacterium]